MSHPLYVLIASLSIGLVGCGGGSDANSTTVAAAIPATAAGTTMPVATPTAPTTTPGFSLAPAKTCNIANFQQTLMALINQARASSRQCGGTAYKAVAALQWNSRLFEAAAGHSAEMVANNYFSHTSLDGSNFGQRLSNAGYVWSAIGENIAAGPRSVDEVMTGWLNSPGHCSNIMGENFTEVGLACVSGSSSQYPSYWTMDLGRP
ncbi:CAP domain-containing protein [soil metagenome]